MQVRRILVNLRCVWRWLNLCQAPRNRNLSSSDYTIGPISGSEKCAQAAMVLLRDIGENVAPRRSEPRIVAFGGIAPFAPRDLAGMTHASTQDDQPPD
ncbi:MAG TPA: hypothetical protein PLI13_02425 [Paracoccus sp. (in: a-proteobacteria)]|nr:hypothetical protein [Paracoccus sp. (in: a-proteobacteria)]